MGRSLLHDPIDIASPEFKANPFPYYAQLRAESPVHRVNLRIGSRPWLVTRYDDVVTVLKDDRFVKSSSNAMTPEQLGRQPWFLRMFRTKWLTPLRRNLINVDPPDHTRLRVIVTKAFTPRRIEQLHFRIQKLADELLDIVEHRGNMDLIRDYALPMPTTIITEMLGVPPEDRRQFYRWTNAIAAMFSSKTAMLYAVPNMWTLMRYIRDLIRHRRADPHDDLISALIRAEEAGDTLSEDELLGMIILLLLAGYETTANLIGSGILTLLEHPDQFEKLRYDPSLIKPGLEELLRYTSPADMASARYTREDVTIAGVTIPRGEGVFAVVASANRDGLLASFGAQQQRRSSIGSPFRRKKRECSDWRGRVRAPCGAKSPNTLVDLRKAVNGFTSGIAAATILKPYVTLCRQAATG